VRRAESPGGRPLSKGRAQWIRLCLLLLALVGVIAGCARTISGARPDLLSFLRTGTTSREEVLLKLGEPSASFERDRILTYRIGKDPRQGYYVVLPTVFEQWQQVRYSLVLVFDAGGVLEKESLVAVQGPVR
jgi:hypothetical protein